MQPIFYSFLMSKKSYVLCIEVLSCKENGDANMESTEK